MVSQRPGEARPASFVEPSGRDEDERRDLMVSIESVFAAMAVSAT